MGDVRLQEAAGGARLRQPLIDGRNAGVDTVLKAGVKL